MIDFSEKELLNYALDSGILDLHTIRAQIIMEERKRILEKHDKKIWQNAKGKWHTYLPDENFSRGIRLIKKSTYEELEDAIVEFYKDLFEPRIEEIFDMWIEQKIHFNEVEKQTIDRYRTDFKRYFIGSELEKIKFRLITERMLEHFIRETIAKYEMKNKTWANFRVIINGIFNYGYKEGYSDIKISVFMGELKLSKALFRHDRNYDTDKVFSDEEAKNVIQYIEDNEKTNVLAQGVCVAFYTGLRIGELCALTWDDLDFDNHLIAIRKTEIRYRGEDGKYVFEIRNSPKSECGFRDVAMTEEVEYIFRRMLQSRDKNCSYIFQKKGKWINSRLFSQKLYRICDKLNIPRKSMHKARMTYATKLIDNNVADSVVMKQMGHSDITTTLRYYYHSNKNKQEMVDIIRKSVNY